MPLDDEVRGNYQFSDRDDDVDDLGYGVAAAEAAAAARRTTTTTRKTAAG